MGFDRAQLKQKVKQSMRGTRPRPMLVTLAFSVIVSMGSWLLNAVLGRLLTNSGGSLGDSYLHYLQRGYEVDEAVEQVMLDLMGMGPGAIFGIIVGGTVLSLLVALWAHVMNVGYEGYCLSMVRQENPPLGKVFCALPQIGPVLLTRVLTGVFLILWSLLLTVVWAAVIMAAAFLTMAIDSQALMVLVMLVSIPALWVGAAWVMLRYALVDYVLLDQGLYGLDAIREGRRLMKGNTGKALMLQLSFLGWYVLLVLIIYTGVFLAIMSVGIQLLAGGTDDVGGLLASAGVALVVVAVAVIGAAVLGLWLRPYVTGAMARFYDWARGAPAGSAGGPGAGSWSGPSDYAWTSGSRSGAGTGPKNGGLPPVPPPQAPAPPRPKPKDDPWN